jgi:manganese/iron transport system permease protein
VTVWLLDPFSAPYMQRALLAAVLLGVLAGVVGVHVALRRLTFMADAFTHTVFPGLAIAFATGTSLFAGALLAGIASALAFTVLERTRRVGSDAALAVVLTSFFAVGVIVVSRTERYTADLNGLLFGGLLTVDRRELTEIAAVLVLVLAVVAATHKELVMRAFDPEFARAAGYRLWAIDLLLNLTIVLVVVAAAQAVGTLLTVALLTTPAATARLVSRSVAQTYLVSAAVGGIGAWLGLAVAYRASIDHDVRLAPAATVVLAITLIFALVLAARAVVRSVVHRGHDPDLCEGHHGHHGFDHEHHHANGATSTPAGGQRLHDLAGAQPPSQGARP